MIFNRVYAQPSKNTFTIKPIMELLLRYVNGNKIWLDPFANGSNLGTAVITNDLNSKYNTEYNLDFREFFKEIRKEKIEPFGILVDPPFSTEQAKRSYESVGVKFTYEDSHGLYPIIWKEIMRLQPEYVIQLGWITGGRKDYYEVVEVLDIVHGGNHYDTLVSVHKKLNGNLEDW